METNDLAPYRSALSELLRQPPRQLTRAEAVTVLPPRGPSGAPENKLRGVVVRSLRAAGFRIDWKPGL